MRCGSPTIPGPDAAPNSTSSRSGSNGGRDSAPRTRWSSGPRPGPCIHGRLHVAVKDIQALAKPILRHRIIPNFYAEAEGINPERIIEQLIETVPLPKSGL